MDTYSTLIVLSSLVIFSYLFDNFSRRTRVPSVLLLLILGAVLRSISIYLNFPLYDFTALLPLLGVVGLILIVFEGALELKYEKGKAKLIRTAFGAALLILIVSSVAIGYLFYYFTTKSFYDCLLNAIPYSVISSSIAIPSVASLIPDKKEFIIYESSFSDILGIMLFNVILVNNSFTSSFLMHFGKDIVLVTALSLLSCFVFLFVMGKVTHHVKFFLIISALVLVYAVGKQIHLSTLVVVLAFGLFLENIELIAHQLSRIRLLAKIESFMLYPALRSDLKSLHQLSAESAFLLRTFFFLVFGYTLDPGQFLSLDIFLYGTVILVIIYLVRWFYLKNFTKPHLWPEWVISPRGLISVLLLLSIPQEKRLFSFDNGLLIYIILVSGILMTIGLIAARKQSLPATNQEQ